LEKLKENKKNNYLSKNFFRVQLAKNNNKKNDKITRRAMLAPDIPFV